MTSIDTPERKKIFSTALSFASARVGTKELGMYLSLTPGDVLYFLNAGRVLMARRNAYLDGVAMARVPCKRIGSLSPEFLISDFATQDPATGQYLVSDPARSDLGRVIGDKAAVIREVVASDRAAQELGRLRQLVVEGYVSLAVTAARRGRGRRTGQPAHN